MREREFEMECSEIKKIIKRNLRRTRNGVKKKGDKGGGTEDEGRAERKMMCKRLYGRAAAYP